jgi:hypothetical protein
VKNHTAIVYAEEWSVKLQERLSENVKWKDFMDVRYTNSRVIYNPYKTDATLASLTPYTAYAPGTPALTEEHLTVNVPWVCAEYIDRADLVQSTYLTQMDTADRQGILMNEKIESLIYAQYGLLTTFDNTQIGGAAGNITVTSSNIDDIIRAMKREISESKGDAMLERNGAFMVWRPADFELLEAFCQANGFSTADTALRGGVKGGFEYMGVTHYKSQLLTAGHLIGGVKKLFTLGVLKSTYGQIMVDEKDPGLVSGISVVSRFDIGYKMFANYKPLVFNITVA